jgi:hypothetical protein
MTDDDRASLRWLRDRVEIEETSRRFGRAADSRDDEERNALLDSCMTDDVEVQYPWGTWHGREEEKRKLATGISALFRVTRHMLTNALIEIDGDRATAEYYVTSPHAVQSADGEKFVWGGGIYRQELVRTRDGWRIAKHHCTGIWIDDDGSLVTKTAENAREHGFASAAAPA